MPFRIVPFDDDEEQRNAMVFLPPGGRHNDLIADRWAPLAELESQDVTAVLDFFAEAGIAGYAAIPGGRRAQSIGRYHLYVDRRKFNEAEDAFMAFLRGKEPRLVGGVRRRPPVKATTAAPASVTAPRPTKRVDKILLRYFIAAALAAGTLFRFFEHGRPVAVPLLMAAAVGVLCMATVDLGIKARYWSTNRALKAKGPITPRP